MKARSSSAQSPSSPEETIHGRGLRMTDQRRAIYDALMGRRDHPTAVEVFMRVKPKMPSISLATVYNCLETLAGCGLVKTVHHDRQPSRYCPNLEEHAHLFCDQCRAVVDIPLRLRPAAELWEVPANVVISRHEVSFRGLCPRCAPTREVSRFRKSALPGARKASKPSANAGGSGVKQ